MSVEYPMDSLNHLDMLEDVAGEGELPVDIGETAEELIIRAPIAGCDASQITIHLNGDILTIRGERSLVGEPHIEHYFSEECFWGNFSRSIILPVDVVNDSAQATFKNGMLSLRFTKKMQAQHIPIVVIDEE